MSTGLRFSKEHLKNVATMERTATGYFALLSSDPELKEDKNGYRFLQIKWRMLSDASDPTSVVGNPISGFYYLFAGLPDEASLDEAGKEQLKKYEQRASRGTIELCSLLSNKVDAPPVFDHKTQKWMFKGKPVVGGRQEKDRLVAQILGQCEDVVNAIIEDPSTAAKKLAFGEVFYQNQGGVDSHYPSVRGLTTKPTGDLSTSYTEYVSLNG